MFPGTIRAPSSGSRHQNGLRGVAGDVDSVCLVLVCRTVSPAATVPAGVGAVSGSKFCSVNQRSPWVTVRVES